ncbi:unnamed protein product [Schistosoma turkestanicum]|nr:unnamed protein product [Schistosoma turkestanicum]
MAFLMDSVLTNIFNDNTEMSSIGGGRKFNLNTECSSSSNNNNTNHNHDSQNHRECMEPMLPSTESLLQTNPLLIGQSSVYTYSSNSNHQQQPQPPSLTPTSNIPNPIIIGSCEKHSPQLDSNSPRISQGNNNSSTSSTQLNLIRCPLAPCSSASDSAVAVAAAATAQPQSINRIDVNFQQCRQVSDDILHSSSSTGSSNSSSSSNSNSSDPAAFYHYNSIIPKNVNSTLVIVDDQSSSLLLTDHPKQPQHPQPHDTISSTASAHTTNTFCNVLMNEMNLLSSGEMSSLRNAASRGVQQQYKQFIDDLL